MEIVLDVKYKNKCDPDLKKYFLSFSMHMIYIYKIINYWDALLLTTGPISSIYFVTIRLIMTQISSPAF